MTSMFQRSRPSTYVEDGGIKQSQSYRVSKSEKMYSLVQVGGLMYDGLVGNVVDMK